MVCAIRAIVVGFFTAFAGLAVPGVAAAEPAPPCSYTLTPPHVEQIAGTAMVTATLTPSACGFPASPYQGVACLQIQGEDSAKQCAQARGFAPAHVVLGPYRPGATYVATGRGCGSWAGNLPAPDCQLLGPDVATL
jgi:hypothetical protein